MKDNNKNLIDNSNNDLNQDSIKLNSSIVGKTIATKVPLNMYEELIFLVENGAYLSISDFLRESIRNQLKKYKVSKIKDISYNDAKNEVLSYFMEFNDCYLDELALDLNIDFKLLSEIIDDLLLEGRIQFNDFSNIDSDIDFNSNFIKLYGKRIIIESKSKNNEYLKLKSLNSINIKFKGCILENGIAIISNHYSFIK